MIVVTGAGGFIGSRLIKHLNELGIGNIIAVDDFDQPQKKEILNDTYTKIFIDRSTFINFLKENHEIIDTVYHLGARTDTTEPSVEIFNKLNLNFTKAIWNICTEHGIPLIYASSAATYGDGEFGYDDENMNNIGLLKPLNPYGDSKQEFDLWALQREETPPFWIGLKFFNVYGYGEFNKGRMASVVFHGIKQFNETGKIKLFKSHHPDYNDGEQMRDFISVDDVVRVCHEFRTKGYNNSGIYNVGTGKARTFLDLANSIFKGIGVKPNIEFIDTPMDIRGKYQYFTEATTKKLKKVGIDTNFIELEEGIKKYYIQSM